MSGSGSSGDCADGDVSRPCGGPSVPGTGLVGMPRPSSRLQDVRIELIRPLIPPACLMETRLAAPLTEDFIARSREEVADIVHKRDDRLVVVVGPCSVHDVDAARAYARLLKERREALSAELVVVMRVYFEKPRTTTGWKGLINDPDLDQTFNINEGLRLARELLLDVNAMGVPAGCEWLDTITPQYIADLVSWGAIGARTSESQTHRQLVSGLSMPVGFKNSTSGNVDVAINGVISSCAKHCFTSVNELGMAGIVVTRGNPDGHVILRGGASQPNYGREHVKEVADACAAKRIDPAIMVDCSHANSGKDYTRQPAVAQAIADQVREGNTDIIGVMIESNLHPGKQAYNGRKAGLRYGVSITDGCAGWDTTVEMLDILAQSVRDRREAVKAASK